MAKSLKKDMVGSFRYVLKVNGTVLEEVPQDDAVEYLHGAENIVPGLENSLLGKQAGDKYTVKVKPADAYGDYDENLVEEIPHEDIEDGEELEEGMLIELFDDEEDDIIDAVVIEVTDVGVKVDMNHELAGKTLEYEVEVLSVREATKQELETGLPERLMDEIGHMIQDMFEVITEDFEMDEE